jgi:hypothetical protein
MRECLKVILGVLALTVGASAPTLIVESLHPGVLVALNPPTPSGRDTQREREAQSSQHHRDTQSAHDGSTNAPIFAQNQSPGEHAIAANPKEQGEWYTRPDWWVAGFTAALFIATTGLWIFTALLWLSTRRAVMEGQEAISAAQASAAAANAHARAAEEANKINREVLTVIDRPWIGVRMEIPEGKPVIFGTDEIQATIKIFAKNVGKSPATKVNYNIELCPDSVAANDRVNSMGRDLREVPNLAAGYGRLLIPDQEFSIERSITTSVAEFRKFLQETASAAQADEADTSEVGEAEPFYEACPAVIAAVWYGIPSDRLPRHTIIVGQITNTAPGKIGFDGSEGMFPNVEIVESPMGNRAS